MVSPYAEGLGAYVWPDRDTGERFARCRVEAEVAAARLIQGEGTERTLAPGRRFTLTDHFDFDPSHRANTGAESASNVFTLLRVEHHARNNVGASLTEQVGQQQASAGAAALYTNRFIVLPAAQPYRARLKDSQGRVRFAAPPVRTQTAHRWMHDWPAISSTPRRVSSRHWLRPRKSSRPPCKVILHRTNSPSPKHWQRARRRSKQPRRNKGRTVVRVLFRHGPVP